MLALLLTSGLLVAVLTTRARFLNLFMDFDTELPHMTKLALSPISPVVIGALLAFTLGIQFVRAWNPYKPLINTVICCLTVVLGLAYFFACYMPLMSIMRALA